MQRKSIIQGRLEFASEKSFNQMYKMYEYRIDNFYKNDILFKDDVFDDENLLINIPRLINIQEEKHWENTIKLLEYLAQFAIAGSISAWLVHEGKILQYAVIEPDSDKAVVQTFIKGQKLASEIGKEEEAIAALTRVIEKRNSHAQAYERRGFVNYIMGDYAGALYDFNKCISYDPSIPSAYYWKARVHMRQEQWEEALEDLDMTTKKAIALQPVYWKARRRKAYCYINLGQYENAAKELMLFTKRNYEKDNPNYAYLRECYAKYAEVLIKLDRPEEALEAIVKGIELTDQEEYAPEKRLLTLRGLAKHKLGEGGQDDLQRAAELGSDEAEKLLAKLTA